MREEVGLEKMIQYKLYRSVMLELEEGITTWFQVGSVDHIIQNTDALECEKIVRLLSSNEVQFTPGIHILRLSLTRGTWRR